MDTTFTPVVSRTAEQKLNIVRRITCAHLALGGTPAHEAMQQIAAVVETDTAGSGRHAPPFEKLLQSWDTLAASTATSGWEEAYRLSRANAAKELRAAIAEATGAGT